MAITVYKHKKSVPALTNDVLEIIIPNGENWSIQSFSASPNHNTDTNVQVIWDLNGGEETIIEVAYTSVVSKTVMDEDILGDGVKKISICLVNNTLNAEVLAAEITVRTP